MKKLLCIIMSVFVLCTSSFTAKAEEEKTIYFEDPSTICIIYYDSANEAYERYYTNIDGVVYTFVCYDYEGYQYAKAIAILPKEENANVKILDTFEFNDEEIEVTEIDISFSSSIGDNITSVEMGDGIRKIRGFDADGVEFVIGKGVYDIEDSFYDSKDLKLSVDPENPYLKIEDGAIYSTYKKELLTVLGSPEIVAPEGNYEIAADVTSFVAPFGKEFRIDNQYIKSITINGNLDEFELGSLINVKKINISENVTKINYIDISGAEKLAEVDFSKVTAKSIYACSIKKLKKISLPKNCVIESKAFGSCKNLKKVIVNDTKKAPKIKAKAFNDTSKGIKFYTKSKKIAKQLKKNLKFSGIKKAKIYVGKKLVFKNVNSKKVPAWM